MILAGIRAGTKSSRGALRPTRASEAGPERIFLKGELSQAQAHYRLKGEEQTIAVCEGLRDRIKSFRARLRGYRWRASALDHPGPCRLIPAARPRPPAGTIARMSAEIELLEKRK